MRSRVCGWGEKSTEPRRCNCYRC